MGLFSGIAKVASSALGLGPITSGLASVAGDFLDDNSSAKAADQRANEAFNQSRQGVEMQNQANAEQAQLNRDFQERMSGTSYQRAVGDMKAAGLSPMLAYSQGGASTPSGATAQMADTLGPAVSAGQSARNLRIAQDQIRAQTHSTEADALLKTSQAEVNKAQIPAIAAQADQNVASAGQLRAQTGLTNTMVSKALAETTNIHSDTERIKAITAKLIEETKNVPITGDHLRQMIALAAAQVYKTRAETRGQIIKNVGDTYGLYGKYNESEWEKAIMGDPNIAIRAGQTGKDLLNPFKLNFGKGK